MSAEAAPAAPATFSARTMLVLVLVGLFAFSAFAVLSTYAPDLRAKDDAGAHALSRSAVGFAGAAALFKAEGAPVLVSRAPDMKRTTASLVVLTPSPMNGAKDLDRLASNNVTLVVLPKWEVQPNPFHPGWVRKAGFAFDNGDADRLLGRLAKASAVTRREGVGRVAVRLAPGIQAWTPEGRTIDFGVLTSGPIEGLQTISGKGWEPVAVDAAGRAVLVSSRARPNVYVLSDPDLMNTQGLASLDTARVASALVEVLRENRDGIVFDVSLHGIGRSRSLGKLLLEPPLLGATLCAVAAALLMGAHAVARFGPTPPSARAFALGARGLVDNSAGLVRMARREAELARPYAALTEAQVLKAAGGEASAERLDRLEEHGRVTVRRRELTAATEAVKTPDDLLAAARRWRQWRLEMTRDRR